MNEYGYYGWSKVHDNSVRLPMYFSMQLYNPFDGLEKTK